MHCSRKQALPQGKGFTTELQDSVLAGRVPQRGQKTHRLLLAAEKLAVIHTQLHLKCDYVPKKLLINYLKANVTATEIKLPLFLGSQPGTVTPFTKWIRFQWM